MQLPESGRIALSRARGMCLVVRIAGRGVASSRSGSSVHGATGAASASSPNGCGHVKQLELRTPRPRAATRPLLWQEFNPVSHFSSGAGPCPRHPVPARAQPDPSSASIELHSRLLHGLGFPCRSLATMPVTLHKQELTASLAQAAEHVQT